MELFIHRETQRLSYRLAVAIVALATNECLALNLVLPFARDLVLAVGVSPDDAGLAAAVVTGVYGLGLALGARLWGSMSDKYGRRFVMGISALSSAVSILGLGFAKTLFSCILIRFIGGLCNGLICVLKSAVSDIVTDTKGQSQAFSLLQVASSLGAIVGPTIGGMLLGIYHSSTKLTNQFFFPCFSCAILQLLLATIGIILFPSSHRPQQPNSKPLITNSGTTLLGKKSIKEYQRFRMSPQVQKAMQSAMDGDTIGLTALEKKAKPKKKISTSVFEADSSSDIKNDTKLEDDVHGNKKLFVYDVGSSDKRRFKIHHEPSAKISFRLSAVLNAFAALADEMANVAESLSLTAPTSNGAGLSDSAAGLTFGMGGLLMLLFIAFGLPKFQRFFRGSQIALFQFAEISFALTALLFPIICFIPSSNNNQHNYQMNFFIAAPKPQIPIKQICLVIILGFLNSASATALISSNVLCQQALIQDSSNIGKGNGFVQSLIATGRVLGPLAAGATFDFFVHVFF
mmetsp:Transcript_7891/g.10047  ORF Transcript_7891/g.10047 Transcript_7891/m.10047 type:complete len:516 (-) Transcript_7891:10-1557(-)